MVAACCLESGTLSFSALMLLVGSRKGIRLVKSSATIYPKFTYWDWTNLEKLQKSWAIKQQESPADARVTRDSSACIPPSWIFEITITSAVPENPNLQPNSTSIGKPVAKLWPFLYISKMAVSRYLGFYRIGNSAIRSAFRENPSYRTKRGVDRMHRLRDIRL